MQTNIQNTYYGLIYELSRDKFVILKQCVTAIKEQWHPENINKDSENNLNNQLNKLLVFLPLTYSTSNYF